MKQHSAGDSAAGAVATTPIRYVANLHTHTTFCDGTDSAETLVHAALDCGMTVLGFSGHSMYPFSTDWHIAVQSHDDYCAEICRLQTAFADRLRILLGFEADYLAPVACPRFERYAAFSPDYLIGSVHYVVAPNGSGAFTVDSSAHELVRDIRAFFGGDARTAVCAYFAAEREMLTKGDFSIIAHPDLVRKYNASLRLFDETDEWYKRELRATAEAIARAGVIAEINTGGMVRAGMQSPYPSAYFLSLLHERGVPVAINSDAHCARDIAAHLDHAREYAKKVGYTEGAIPCAGTIDFYRL